MILIFSVVVLGLKLGGALVVVNIWKQSSLTTDIFNPYERRAHR